MAENFSRNVLRIVIAQISQAVGFDSIQSSSLEILTNILERYLHNIGKKIHDYGEQRGETVPDLDDLYFAFRQLGISLPEIVDYTKQMESVKFAHNVAMFPAPKQANLGFPSSFEPDDLKRDEHIPLHMPSLVTSSLKPAEPQSDNAIPQKDSFVIAKKNPQNFSSDEEIYSAGDDSSDGEYISDDSLSYNHSKTRHLTKPEDIPMVEGTAPSSLMSVPSVSELDDGNSFTTSSRKTSLDKFEGDSDRSRAKERHAIGSKTSASAIDVPWMTRDEQNGSKRKPIDSGSRSGHAKSTDPSWLSEKKKPADVYDPGWLQEEDSSLVHLNKPSTADVPRSSSSSEKRSWFSKDKQASPDTKLNKPFSQKHSTSSKYSKLKSSSSASLSHKHSTKPNADRKLSHQKSYKTPPNAKKSGADDQIKARIEAAERLLHSAPVPPYVPPSPKSHDKKSHHAVKKSPAQSGTDAERKTKKASASDTSNYQPAKSSSSKQKAPSKSSEEKQDRSNFASSESMMKAIDAVINRASEESVRQDKEAEEADLMKFMHLVSSSSESESDYVVKAEQMLQLEERGLQGTRPASPASSSISSIDTPASLSDSDSNDSIEIPPKIPEPPPAKEKVKKEKRKKKSKRKDEKSPVVKSPKSRPKGKKSKQKQASFVTTETITPNPVKMKVKLKPMPKEPKLFDVAEDKDRIKVTHPPPKPHKEEKTKQRESKHSKHKEHKAPAAKTSSETKRDSSEQEHSVGKIILKKSKSGDAKVVKPKAKEHARSPSPVSSRSNLPLPKLSAAVPVTSVTLTTKEKKKSKKEKKKKREKERDSEKDRGAEREKHSEKTTKESKDKTSHHKESKDSKSSRKSPYDSDGASPLVPKLTLKMGASEKKFVIKPPSVSSSKASAKKRPHSGNDSPKPAKERKISVDCVKTVSEGFAAAVERKVITQTISVGPVGVYEDGDGNMVWICPGCNKQDDGSPMIGCDMCDDWYHWPCVKITQEPPDDVDWYCPRCTKRQQLAAKGKVSVKKKKKK